MHPYAWEAHVNALLDGFAAALIGTLSELFAAIVVILLSLALFLAALNSETDWPEGVQ